MLSFKYKANDGMNNGTAMQKQRINFLQHQLKILS